MTAAFFLGFVALMAGLVIGLTTRLLGPHIGRAAATGLSLWLLYVGLLGYFGVTRATNLRPPGMAFILVPVVIVLVLTILKLRTPTGAKVARCFPLWIVLGAQSFRVIVELFLHQLWRDGVIPKMLTFSGSNVDIYIGATAPFAAWIATRGRGGRQLALVWNGLGLLALANVVSRAVLSAPGPFQLIHAEVPNLMFGTFPYMFIPALFVPLALILHAIAIRNLATRMSLIPLASKTYEKQRP